MTNPFSNGVIHQQDVRDRSIARQRIAQAIAREQKRVDYLIDCAVELVLHRGMTGTTVDRIWTAFQSDEQLRAIRLIADSNVADYTEYTGWLNGQRLNIETRGRMRLAAELNEAVYQYRYANTVGFRPAYAACS